MLNSYRVKDEDETPHSIDQTLITNEDVQKGGRKRMGSGKYGGQQYGATEKRGSRVNNTSR